MNVHVSMIGTHRIFELAKTASREAFVRSGIIATLAAILLKWILASTSGRSFSSEYLDLSLLFAVGSFLWMSSDRRFLLR